MFFISPRGSLTFWQKQIKRGALLKKLKLRILLLAIENNVLIYIKNTGFFV
jgi:hypothetical protein